MNYESSNQMVLGKVVTRHVLLHEPIIIKAYLKNPKRKIVGYCCIKRDQSYP